MNIEVKCPRCGSPCAVRNSEMNEYECARCGSVFRFIDAGQKTVLHETLTHNCPSCGAPVEDKEEYVCTECGREWLCPKCIKNIVGKYVCSDCMKKKMYVVVTNTSTDETCPRCDGKLRYIEEHNQWYCPQCQEYATHFCQECGSLVKAEGKYGVLICHRCLDTEPKEDFEKKRSRLQSS